MVSRIFVIASTLLFISHNSYAIAKQDIDEKLSQQVLAKQMVKKTGREPLKPQCQVGPNYGQCLDEFSETLLELHANRFQAFGDSIIAFPIDISMAPKVFHQVNTRFTVGAYYPQQDMSIISESSWDQQYSTAHAYFHKTGKSIEAYRHITFASQDDLLAVYNWFDWTIEADGREPNRLTIYNNQQSVFDFRPENYGVAKAFFENNQRLILKLTSWGESQNSVTCAVTYQHRIWQFEDISCLDALSAKSAN